MFLKDKEYKENKKAKYDDFDDTHAWLKDKAVSFSDAVIAIIITVMVLEIPIPSSMKEYPDFIGAILIFIISFFVVANFWYTYHRVMRGITSFSKTILVLNFIYIATLSLIPLFSKWIMQDTINIAVVNYGIVYLFVQLIQMLLLYKSMKEKNILPKEARRRVFIGRLYMQLSLNIILIILAWFFPKVIMVLYLALPILSFFSPSIQPQGGRRQRQHTKERPLS